MKRKTLVLLVFSLLAAGHYLQAQVKFGEVPLSDLTMTVCAADTSAEAMVLNEDCSVVYDITGDNLNVVTYYTVRVKVFKTSGLDRANIVVAYFEPESGSSREDVSGISGFTYNLEGGKVQKTKLGKEYIFTERTTESYKQVKIAMPNVKVGSVFEVKYTLRSPYYSTLKSFAFQSSIPVLRSHYDVSIPEYFTFSKKTLGYEPISYKEENCNISFMLYGESIHCSGKKMMFDAVNLPALKNDGYVWDVDDFRSGVLFELAGIQFPRSTYQSFSRTWNDIDKLLLDDESFGRQLNYSNLLKDELNALIKPEMSEREKVDSILQLVKRKVKWNEKDRLYSKNVKSALKEGTGTSAEINALLICLLKDAGFDAYPVIMSQRSNGRLFTYYPSISKLNYFVVGVDTKDGPLYMDASFRYGSVNVLPTDCMVDNARTIRKGKPCEWVDLHQLGRSVRVAAVAATFNENGTLSGTLQEQLSGAYATALCKRYSLADNDDKFIEGMDADMGLTFSECKVTGCGTSSVLLQGTFENKNISLDNEYVYINPLLSYALKENPFKAEVRKLPVEFAFPYNQTISVSIAVPEGYTVEEMPSSEKLVLENGNITFTFLAKQSGNMLQFSYRMVLQQTIFPSTEYEVIRNMWANIAAKGNAQVVLKRTAAATN